MGVIRRLVSIFDAEDREALAQAGAAVVLALLGVVALGLAFGLAVRAFELGAG
ncbi:MAG: hypothetical protein AB7P33_09785 [Dehalococcoidia bacterium]